MKRTRVTRTGLVSTAACVFALAVGGAAPARTPEVAGAEGPVATWSTSLWESALKREGQASLDLLKSPPVDVEALGGFRAEVERFKLNLAASESHRVERVALVRERLAEASKKGDLLEGLRNAIELYTLERDKTTVTRDPQVMELEDAAITKAREHESAGRWLEAHGLFTRLHLLHETEGTYKGDLKRLSTRILMMRTYTPEALHEARNRQRVAEGEEKLPPYNDMGEKWQERLAGVDERMVLQVMMNSTANHVERTPLKNMLGGALSNLLTLATTSDLAAAFPGLGDQGKRETFAKALNAEINRLEADADRVDGYYLMSVLRNVKKTNEETIGLPMEALVHEFGNGATSTLDDYSEIIWPDELASFSRTTTGEFSGVGIQITLDDAMQLKVVTPLEGTPAQKAGVRPNDIIRKINGRDTTGIQLQQAVDRITGQLGTNVALGLEREGEDGLIEVDLTRAKIPVHSVKGWERVGPGELDWDWFVDREHAIGYIRLTQFTKDTTADIRKALNQMKQAGGPRGLILDLRYNPGGLLDEAVNVSSLFVNDGVVVSQEDNKGQQTDVQRIRTGNAKDLEGVPVVVLINEGSASASEIVAGCLQDYGRAVVVGERSFGKGSVQQVFPLSGGTAAFKLTMQYYKLPNGRLVHRRDNAKAWGVEPDVKVEMLPRQVEQTLILRQDADLFTTDEAGKRIEPMVRALKPKKNPKPTDAEDSKHWPVGPADPDRLLNEGMDPQLETALLLVQARTFGLPAVAAAKGGGAKVEVKN
ncbi:MAG: S41 family peptidase [Phycisphaerales bacterium]